MLIKDFAGKKTAVWGLGREGKAVLRKLRENDVTDVITIITDVELLPEEKEALSHLQPLEFVFGENILSAIKETEIIVKAPGVSLYREEIVEAKNLGKKVTSSSNIWFAECRKNSPNTKIIGITGTKGKSTTTSLIAYLLRVLGKNTAVGGNIGVPLIEFVGNNLNLDYMVAEISSYQASDIEYSPDFSILLNLYPEHVDWHKNHNRYYNDKLNLFKNRINSAPMVVNSKNKRAMEMTADFKDVVYYNSKESLHVEEGFITDGVTRLYPVLDLPIKGEHNFENICGALSVLRMAGENISDCIGALKSFVGLSHRLQELGEHENVLYVNDSISTTPETAIAGMEAYNFKPVTLIAGGYDRSQNYSELASYVSKPSSNVVAVVTMNQTGCRIAEAIRLAKTDDTIVEVFEEKGLEDAFVKAKEITPKGGVILLSPAAPSYGAYKNFEERGDHFKRLCNMMWA